jgi:hypothetical protein
MAWAWMASKISGLHPTTEQIAYLFDRFGPYLRIDPDVGPATLL